jgi:hypothetical protein
MVQMVGTYCWANQFGGSNSNGCSVSITPRSRGHAGPPGIEDLNRLEARTTLQHQNLVGVPHMVHLPWSSYSHPLLGCTTKENGGLGTPGPPAQRWNSKHWWDEGNQIGSYQLYRFFLSHDDAAWTMALLERSARAGARPPTQRWGRDRKAWSLAQTYTSEAPHWSTTWGRASGREILH